MKSDPVKSNPKNSNIGNTNADTPNVDTRLREVKELAESACEALQKEVFKNGLPASCIDPSLERASFKVSRDPYDGSYSLIGVWRDEHDNKQGEILFHSDGSFFAEYDVISEHPRLSQWFIESVTAWGNQRNLKTELRLLPCAS